jgi:hypothetical protein
MTTEIGQRGDRAHDEDDGDELPAAGWSHTGHRHQEVRGRHTRKQRGDPVDRDAPRISTDIEVDRRGHPVDRDAPRISTDIEVDQRAEDEQDLVEHPDADRAECTGSGEPGPQARFAEHGTDPAQHDLPDCGPGVLFDEVAPVHDPEPARVAGEISTQAEHAHDRSRSLWTSPGETATARRLRPKYSSAR